MSDLRSQLIKLGNANPDLRPHIREVLKARTAAAGIDPKIQAVADKIYDLTDYNNHTLALYELAKFLKNKKYMTVLKGIDTIHKADGGMHPDLGKYRNWVNDQLDRELKSKHSKEVFELIMSSF